MNRATMVGLGCGGFALVAALAGFWGWWSTVRGMDMTDEPAEVRARTAAIVALVPSPPLTPFFARTMERGGGDRAVIWSVDSRFQNLMLVIREIGIEPASAEEMVEALALVHPGLSGFDPQPGGQRVPVRVLGQERTALIQTALTVDESKQTRACVAFEAGGKWVLLMLQGDAGGADAEALQRLLGTIGSG